MGARLAGHRREQDGSAVVEAVILVPAIMILLLFVVQACLWAHAASVVQAAAQQGEQTASGLGGSTAAGEASARSFLASTGGGSVQAPSVHAQVFPGDMVAVQISASAESIIPGLHLEVSAVRTGPRQEFRVSS